MIRHWVLIYDAHCDDKMTREYKLAKKFIKHQKPYGVLLGGDFGHIESLTHWNETKKRTAENQRYKKECDILNGELDFFQKHSKKVVYLEGNHEEWVEQYIEKYPECEDILELANMLRLKERGIEWIRLNELYRIGNLYLTHGMYINQYHAKKHLEKLGCNIAYGHAHVSQSFQQNQKMSEPHMAWSIPCLCNNNPTYLRGKPSNWMNGFANLYVDTKTGNFNLYPVNILSGKFLWEGKLWSLTR